MLAKIIKCRNDLEIPRNMQSIKPIPIEGVDMVYMMRDTCLNKQSFCNIVHFLNLSHMNGR